MDRGRRSWPVARARWRACCSPPSLPPPSCWASPWPSPGRAPPSSSPRSPTRSPPWSLKPDRARAFAWVSSGTGAGVAVAAPLAFVAADWRLAWVLFAVVAALTTLLAARVVPATPLAPTQGGHTAPAPARHAAAPGLRPAGRAGCRGVLDLGRRPCRHRRRSRHRRRPGAAGDRRGREPRRGAGGRPGRPRRPAGRSRRLRPVADRFARRAGPRARGHRRRDRGGHLLRRRLQPARHDPRAVERPHLPTRPRPWTGGRHERDGRRLPARAAARRAAGPAHGVPGRRGVPRRRRRARASPPRPLRGSAAARGR